MGERRTAWVKKAAAWATVGTLLSATTLMIAKPANAAADPTESKKPNIVFIMADDIGMWNIGAYHRGMMAGRTPNLDKRMKNDWKVIFPFEGNERR